MSIRSLLRPLDSRIERTFGRRRGLLQSARAAVALSLGRFAPLRSIDWQRVERLVFVCLGNICRSPYAELRARRLGLPATSYGLETRGGKPAHPVIARLASLRGLDLASHLSRRAGDLRPGPGDLLLAMEPGQLREVAALARTYGCQYTLLGLWSSPARPHIQDPYGLSEAYAQTCLTNIDRAVDGLADRLADARRAAGRGRA